MRKRLIIALIVLLVVGVGGYFSFNLVVDHLARRQVEALFADLRAQGIEAQGRDATYDVFSGRFEIHDLSFAAPGQGKLKIVSFLATGTERPSPRRLFARQVEISDLSYEGPLPLAPAIEATYRAPHITIDALEIPSTPPAGTRPWQIALDVLEQTSADRISIPESLVITRAGTGDSRMETDVTHGATRLEKLLAGRFAKATIEPSRFTVGGAPANAASGKVGRVNIETIDVAAMLTLLDPERRQADDQFRTVYGTIRVDGYEAKSDKGLQQRWGAIDIRDIAIRPSIIPAEDLLTLGTELREAAAKGQKPPPELIAQSLRGLAAAYDGIRLGSVVLKDMAVREEDGSHAELATLTLGPLNDGRLDSFVIDRLKGTDADGKVFRIDQLKIGGLRPGTLMELSADATEDPHSTQNIAWFMRLFGVVGSFELAGAEAPAPEGGDAVVVDKLALAWQGEQDAFPTRIAATLRVSGPTSAFPRDNSLFALVPDGMSRASVALDVGGEWNESKGTLTLAPLYAEVSDAFALSLKIKLRDVDESVFSTQPDEAMAGAMMTSLDSIELTVSDAGIYERKLEEAAKEQGMEPEAIRQLLAGFAELLLSSTVADRPELEPATQAFVSFLQKPLGTLALRITPRGDSLPLGTIAETLQGEEPLTLVDELNVQVIEAAEPPTSPSKP